MKIKCPNCNYSGFVDEKTNVPKLVLMILLGILLFPFGLIIPIIFLYKSKHPKCPKCKYKYIVKE